jgi:hypothetical protein
MYHGIIIDKEFSNPFFCSSFKIFNTKRSGDWKVYGIEINDNSLESTIAKIQENLKEHESWYSHLYNGQELIVIFKGKVFKIKPDKSTWSEAIKFGEKLNIPRKQLDFHPSKFEEEFNYFS